MSLQDLRKKIDEIDDGLVELFQRRMDVASEVARFKQENGIAVYDPERERQKLYDISGKVAKGRERYVTALYALLFELSRSDQERILNPASALAERISAAVSDTPQTFPERAMVACQGVEGAYSQLAAERLFALPSIVYCNSFKSVFSAIDSGLCAYGILPLENSTAGSVNQVYDLMMKYPFHIVRSVRLKVDHCLLAKGGADAKKIREIYSHEQAIAQCAGYLDSLAHVKIIPVENTAVAAKMVNESGRDDVAALSSRHCAELYGLKVLADSVQDQGNNYTRFICVSKNLAIYPGADKTSLMLTLSHKPGSLYRILSRFYAHGINLVKLESRPIPNRDFDFMFYFDLDTPVYDPALPSVLREVGDLCEEFYYMGSYSEVM
jgi:chorismate mutase/prephenate dehydratase